MDELIKSDFVIFDVETTGLSPAMGDRVIELAALRVANGQSVEEFHSLVDPKRPVSAGAFMVNGISPQMLLGAPAASEVMPKFLKFIGRSRLVGHNVRFDIGFVANEFSLTGLGWEEETLAICTVRLARAVLPSLGSYRLWWVARALGIKQEQQHRALADVYLTWRVFSKLLMIAAENKLTETELLAKSSSKIAASRSVSSTHGISKTGNAVRE